tara:strand:+ start:14345 stop:14533 length:189 start_codon:yes stop_codon:yes gene_type:complete
MSEEPLELCPQCLGTGEAFTKGDTVKSCLICKGKGEVNADLAEDFISSINVIHIQDDEFSDN